MKVGSKKDECTYSIYIGMCDKDSNKQLLDTDAIIRIIRNVCKGYWVSFSSHAQQGGYISNDGGYVQENSIVLRIIGPSENDINEIAADLCCFLNQESVLVEKQNSTYYSISEKIEYDE